MIHLRTTFFTFLLISPLLAVADESFDLDVFVKKQVESKAFQQLAALKLKAPDLWEVRKIPEEIRNNLEDFNCCNFEITISNSDSSIWNNNELMIRETVKSKTRLGGSLKNADNYINYGISTTEDKFLKISISKLDEDAKIESKKSHHSSIYFDKEMPDNKLKQFSDESSAFPYKPFNIVESLSPTALQSGAFTDFSNKVDSREAFSQIAEALVHRVRSGMLKATDIRLAREDYLETQKGQLEQLESGTKINYPQLIDLVVDYSKSLENAALFGSNSFIVAMDQYLNIYRNNAIVKKFSEKDRLKLTGEMSKILYLAIKRAQERVPQTITVSGSGSGKGFIKGDKTPKYYHATPYSTESSRLIDTLEENQISFPESHDAK